MVDLKFPSLPIERSPLISPVVCVVDDRLRPLDATLETLPLHHFEGNRSHFIGEVTPFFEQYPDCPGIVVMDQERFMGMISRQQILEWFIAPRTNGFEQALSLLIRMARVEPLILPVTTPLLDAAQQVLALPLVQQSDPIVVRIDANTYRLLDAPILLRAAWQVREMEIRLRLERSHIQMIQTEKMASLGRLVNGVAHEILDPVGFIWGNLCHISDYTQDLLQLINAYESTLSPLPTELTELREEIELEYLQEDLPKAIASIQSGADRLKVLASSLQTFCYIDEVYPKPADIHQCLDSIIFLLGTQLSGEIEVVREYGHLPPVTCYIGQLNQVFTNILSNAVQALLRQMENAVPSEIVGEQPLQNERFPNPNEDTTDDGNNIKPSIRITTQVWTQHFEEENIPLAPTPIQENGRTARVSQDRHQSPSSSPESSKAASPTPKVTVAPRQHRWVSIQIADNGPGLSEQQYQQIYHTFSQNQPTKKETSLAVSYRIVTEKHDGKLLVRSPLPPESLPAVSSSILNAEALHTESVSLPKGTEFQILLPIQ